jgi:hypothetical protein
MPPMASRSLPLSRPVAMTRAPAAASRRTVSSPTPDEPPTTTTVCCCAKAMSIPFECLKSLQVREGGLSFKSFENMHHINESDFRRLDLNLLLVFHALLHERSVTRAAQRLFIGQPR